MKSLSARLCLLCLLLLDGTLLIPPARAQTHPHLSARFASLTGPASHKGKVTRFGYQVEFDALAATHPSSCQIQLDTVTGATFSVSLDSGEALRSAAEGMCALALDSFKTGQEITLEEQRGLVLAITVSR